MPIIILSSWVFRTQFYSAIDILKFSINSWWDNLSSRQSNYKTHFEMYSAEVSLPRIPVTQNRGEMKLCVAEQGDCDCTNKCGPTSQQLNRNVFNWGIMRGLPTSGWTVFTTRFCFKYVKKGLSLSAETEAAIMAGLLVPDGAVS